MEKKIKYDQLESFVLGSIAQGTAVVVDRVRWDIFAVNGKGLKRLERIKLRTQSCEISLQHQFRFVKNNDTSKLLYV